MQHLRGQSRRPRIRHEKEATLRLEQLERVQSYLFGAKARQELKSDQRGCQHEAAIGDLGGQLAFHGRILLIDGLQDVDCVSHDSIETVECSFEAEVLLLNDIFRIVDLHGRIILQSVQDWRFFAQLVSFIDFESEWQISLHQNVILLVSLLI